jgi:hypothetical protein
VRSFSIVDWSFKKNVKRTRKNFKIRRKQTTSDMSEHTLQTSTKEKDGRERRRILK